MLLNQASKVIDRIKISSGGLASTAVDVRCVLREALLKRAVAMALCHNHPSGSMRPSTEDDRLTEHLDKAAKVMNIRLIDHVILTDGKFIAMLMKEECRKSLNLQLKQREIWMQIPV